MVVGLRVTPKQRDKIRGFAQPLLRLVHVINRNTDRAWRGHRGGYKVRNLHMMRQTDPPCLLCLSSAIDQTVTVYCVLNPDGERYCGSGPASTPGSHRQTDTTWPHLLKDNNLVCGRCIQAGAPYKKGKA